MLFKTIAIDQGVFSSGLGTVVQSLTAIWKSQARSSILLLCLAMVICQVLFFVVVVVVVVVVIVIVVDIFAFVHKMPVSVHKEGRQ